MRREWILSKNHLSYWLRQLRKGASLIGPLREGNDIVFKSIEHIHEVALDAPALLPSPKEFVFPQYETMFRIKDENRIESFTETERRVVFGVRSCDISALKLLDRFFLQNFEDPYYKARRNNTLFISIVCNNPEPTCFCIGLGTGPYLEEGFDIQLTDLGDRFFVQAGSKEGIKAIRPWSFLFHPPSKTDYEDQYEVFLSSKARFQKRISLEGARNFILSGKIKESFWEGITKRCFECGGCVYECPLCTCFTVTDRVYAEASERARLWDTCLFKGFTRLAGGILPNERRVQRTKRWYYHKLIYYPEVVGDFGCVGCGRCTVTCPGKIDLATVVTKLRDMEDNGQEEK